MYDNTALEQNDDRIYASCTLFNASPNTIVVFTWKYFGSDPLVIDKIAVNSGDRKDMVNLHSKLQKPLYGWPKGRYAVEIGVGRYDNAPKVKYFEIL
jgi:hypothetical protein